MDLQKLFSVVLNMSLTGSIVILIVLLCRLLLRKAPKVFSYALWSVVLFRLLCPVSVSSALSVFNVAKAMAADPVGMVTVVRHPAVSDVLPEQILEMSEPSRGEPIYSGSEEPQDAAPIPYPAYVWLFGVAAMTAYSIHSCRKLNRKLFGAVHLRENLYLADDIPSPFVLGLIRPRIYLPASLAESEQTYIIAHERHHIVRKDNLWKLLAFGALCVHWFNPLVWLAFALAGKDMEMSCDEAVIRRLGAEIRADYSASLLRLSVGHRFPAGTPLAFGEGDTKGRVLNMANWKKPKKWVILCAAVLCVGVLGACAMNPAKETAPEEPSAQTVQPVTEAVLLNESIDHDAAEVAQWLHGLNTENLSSTAEVGLYGVYYHSNRLLTTREYPIEAVDGLFSILKEIPESAISRVEKSKPMHVWRFREAAQTSVIFNDEANAQTVVVRLYAGKAQIFTCKLQRWTSQMELDDFSIWNLEDDALLQYLNILAEKPDEQLPDHIRENPITFPDGPYTFPEKDFENPLRTVTVGDTTVNLYNLTVLMPLDLISELVDAHPDAAEIHIYNWNGKEYFGNLEMPGKDLEIDSMAKGTSKKVDAYQIHSDSQTPFFGYYVQMRNFSGPDEESDCNSRVYWTRFYGNTPEEPDHLPLAVDKLPKWYETCDGWIEYSTDYQIS